MSAYDVAELASLRERMAELTSTDASDWFVVFKARHGMATALAALAEGSGRGSVTVSPFTCVTAVDPVLAAGLTPRYADISDATLALDADQELADEDTLAVVLQHTFGLIGVDAGRIADAAHDAGAYVVEDSAHCVGKMAKDADGNPLADVSVHSFGVEKMLYGTYFGGAVWVSPALPAPVRARLVSSLISLPELPAPIARATRRYRNQMRVLTRVPGHVASRLRARWEKSGAMEPAVATVERAGALSHEAYLPSPWVCSEALSALSTVSDNEAARTKAVSAYLDVFGEEGARALGVPAGFMQAGPFLRLPIFLADEREAERVISAVGALGAFAQAWPRPLLVPGVIDEAAYGAKDGFGCPRAAELSARVCALPTDVDADTATSIARAVLAIAGIAGAGEKGERSVPANLSLIRSEADVAERLQPVVCGADILGYAYVRSYHEAWGIRPIVLSAIDVKVTSSSKLCDYRVVGDLMEEEGLIGALMDLGAELARQGKVGIVHGSADWNTRVISAHKEELSRYFVVPYIDFDLLDDITQKERFYELCEELGIAYPKTWYLDCGSDLTTTDVSQFPYPLIAKPSNSAAWDLIDFSGKKKIYEIADAAELSRVLADVSGSGYTHKLVLQDFVPGGDDAIRSLTTYSDADGVLRVVAGGRVVLQDHSPLALGNPVCILSERSERVIEDAKRFLAHVGYHGYANFDIKYDERDGSWRFFEVNTRPGKNTFYVSLGGVNFCRPIVEDWVLSREVDYLEAYAPYVYTVVPPKVIEEQVTDAALREQVLDAFRRGEAVSPHDYAPDSLAHKLWAELAWRHQVQKFRRYA